MSDGELSSGVASMNINILSPPDTNANGLADDWEAACGVSDPNADADGDGQSNLEEYRANIHPARLDQRPARRGTPASADPAIDTLEEELTWWQMSEAEVRP